MLLAAFEQQCMGRRARPDPARLRHPPTHLRNPPDFMNGTAAFSVHHGNHDVIGVLDEAPGFEWVAMSTVTLALQLQLNGAGFSRR